MTTFNETYEIKSVIGRGGMSTVYLAEHKRLHTRWAVKQVAKQQQGARFDFLAESNILKRLQHPMLPRIVDIFEDDEHIYIVEDYVEGVTLEHKLREVGYIDEKTGLQWLRDLCGAFHYLHGQTPHPIIYRDMKPANVMIQPDGTLKIIDFGIAREYKQESNADTTYIGTRGYAAPEQFGTAQTDARTDIYALGVTMYHALTGKSPYEPPYEFVPARQLNPTLSRGIEYILNKCVRPEPADRYQSVDELLNDLDHIYKFDKAYQKYRTVKRIRALTIVVLLAASAAMIVTGRQLMGVEKENRFVDLLMQAQSAPYEQAEPLLGEARALFPDRIEPDRLQTYLLYSDGQWQSCIDCGAAAIAAHGMDVQTRLSMASAQFELGDYKSAAEGFALDSDLSTDHLRDYAVCLGRLGDVAGAQAALEKLVASGAADDLAQYVRGEVCLAQEQYPEAEAAFLSAMESTESAALTRRCYVSLGDLYRDCAALARVGTSPIATPATRAVELLSGAIVQDGMRYDTVLWEMLALAYFEAYHTDTTAPAEYLQRAADCFNRVIELGISRDYLYTNLYTIYYEMESYDLASDALDRYAAAFPESYMPQALRGMLLITVENQKAQNERDYSAALSAYEAAGALLRSSDDTTYYQQLGNLIDDLRRNGWL